ncbi:MAG: hypothetical protein M0Q51_09060 [Bacteroidales bacterium]|nr:hypothetical protein [Bacteroidales bacterium]
MKKIFLFIILFIFVSILGSCKKDGNGKELNTLQITESEFSGYSHTFTPNLGFWSPVDETTRYIHLVLGDDNNLTNGGENVMSILFYYTGYSQVMFPSPEGQWIRFGINFNGKIYNFQEDNAVLTITQIDDIHFEGSLTGQFMDVSNTSRKISFTLALSLPMQEI